MNAAVVVFVVAITVFVVFVAGITVARSILFTVVAIVATRNSLVNPETFLLFKPTTPQSQFECRWVEQQQ